MVPHGCGKCWPIALRRAFMASTTLRRPASRHSTEHRIHVFDRARARRRARIERGLQNLYGERPPMTPELEDEIAQALAPPTADDDTHPSLGIESIC